VDLAVIATPAKTVADIVEECGKMGVDGVTIISAGFKEIGEDGKKLEEAISEIRKKAGLRIIGPNCVGVIRPPIGLNTSFLKVDPAPGNIAFISQSGALGSSILDWAINTHIGFSLFASLGSMITDPNVDGVLVIYTPQAICHPGSVGRLGGGNGPRDLETDLGRPGRGGICSNGESDPASP
jgi:succinyl-CoA synthetase alpha subunit